MTKTRFDRRKARTHFEQIPIDVVKKIAEVKAPKHGTARPANVIVEPTTKKTEPYSMVALSPGCPSYDDRPLRSPGSDSRI